MGDDETETNSNEERAESVRQGQQAAGLQDGIKYAAKNESARTQFESSDARLNSPPPKSAHHQLYVPIAAGGMARTGDSYRTIW